VLGCFVRTYDKAHLAMVITDHLYPVWPLGGPVFSIEGSSDSGEQTTAGGHLRSIVGHQSAVPSNSGSISESNNFVRISTSLARSSPCTDEPIVTMPPQACGNGACARPDPQPFQTADCTTYGCARPEPVVTAA